MMGRETPPPTHTMRTEISLPAFPLEARCKVCRIYHQDPAVFEELSKRLLLAHRHADIAAWLQEQGHDISERGLARHWSSHLRPYVRETLELERRVRAEVRALSDEPQADLGAALSRQLAAQALATIRRLNLPDLLQRAGDSAEAAAVLRELTRLSKALADIERAQSEIALKEQLVELRKLDLIVKRGRAHEIARQYISMQLAEHPEIREQVLALLQLTEPEAPQPKALTAGTHETRGSRTTSASNSRRRS